MRAVQSPPTIDTQDLIEIVQEVAGNLRYRNRFNNNFETVSLANEVWVRVPGAVEGGFRYSAKDITINGRLTLEARRRLREYIGKIALYISLERFRRHYNLLKKSADQELDEIECDRRRDNNKFISNWESRLDAALIELDQASPRAALLLRLTYFEGVTLRGIAQSWKQNERTIRSQRDRARAVLGELLKKEKIES